MGLRTASVRRRSSIVTMAPALTETKTTTNTFKLTPKTSATCNQSTAAAAGIVNADHSIASSTTQTTAIVRKGIKGDADEAALFHLAADLLSKSDFAFDRCKQTSTDNGMIMNNHDPIVLNPTITNTITPNNQLIQHQPTKDEAMVDQMFANIPSDDDLMQQVIKSIESSVGGVEEELPLPLTASELATLPGNLSSLENALFNAVDMMGMEGIGDQLMASDISSVDKTDDKTEGRTKELIVQVQVKQARLERKLDFLLRRMRKMQVRHMGQHVSAEVAGVYEHVHRTLRRLKDNGGGLTQTLSNNNSGSSSITATASSIDSTALDLSVSASQTAASKDDNGAEVLKPISHGAAKSLVKKLENTRYLQANSASRQRLSARFFGSGSIEPTCFRSSASPATSSSLTLLPTWPPTDKTSLQQTAGQLRAQMAIMQAQLDSEATVSSSGGESCDEMTVYGNVHQQYLAIQKRALWKYSSSRASIAARWSWLLAQIADLEYRIKQHNDLQRSIRVKKGPVILSSALPPIGPTPSAAVNGYKGLLPGCSSTKVSQDDQQQFLNATMTCARIRPLNASTLTKRRLVQTGGLHLVSKKAARPATVRCACVADPFGNASISDSVWKGMNCAVCTGRSDPTHPRDPTEHLSRMERIALLDGGYHPVVSLPEDTSISVHMEAIMKSTEWQQRSSRSSLKAMKYAIKADRMNSDRGEKGLREQQNSDGVERRTGSGKKGEHRRKYNRISGGIKGSTVNALTAKLKSGRPRGRKPNSSRHNNSLPGHKKHRRRHSTHHQRSRDHSASYQQPYANNSTSVHDDMDDDDIMDDREYNRDEYVIGGQQLQGVGSRSGSPLLATQSISGFGRRNRVDSYDIDNIVIPYSVAASTRVERLQYKEILTPKWRMVDTSNLPPIKFENKNNGVVKITSQENEISDAEDISEEAVQQRHDKSEQEEKRKFLSYLKLPFGYYSAPSHRRHLQALHLHNNNNHRRTDSRAESSGANTPDNPVSPAAPQQQPPQQHSAAEESTTSLSSPPAAVAAGTDDLPESLRNLPLSSLSALRRRTISASSSRWLNQRDSTSNDGDLAPLTPIVDVPPFERRQFPLSEENYDKMVRVMPETHHRGTMMNVQNQDNSAALSTTVTAGASGSSCVATTVTNVLPEQHSTLNSTNRSPSAILTEQVQPPRQRRSTTNNHQQQINTSVLGTTAHSIIDDIDSESTESAFGDEDPNDPEWDLEDQISRNSYDVMNRFRR